VTCSGCGQANPAGVQFCGGCGTRLAAVCPACQAPNPPGNRFCHQCGGPLEAKAAADRPTADHPETVMIAAFDEPGSDAPFPGARAPDRDYMVPAGQVNLAVHEWGEIVEWDPPRRLRYRWRIGTAPENATDVEIVFRELKGNSTQIVIEHGGWDRLGSIGPSWREANHAGWDGVLPPYTAACVRS